MNGLLPGLLADDTRHDAGGKTRMRLLPGVNGLALFVGDRDEHRLELWRIWGDPKPFVLWIGMNPSTAEADVDDNTVRIEQRFSREWGFAAYCKTNVMSYRVTNPAGLLQPGVNPADQRNLDIILGLAQQAGTVVLTIGSLPPRLRPYGETVVRVLANAGIQMKCLGVTADGSPRHVRGLPARAEPQPFDPWRYLGQERAP